MRGLRAGVPGDLQGNPGALRRWIIDPIDGTKSYVRGVPIWATLDRARARGRARGRRRVGARARHALVGRAAGSARSATASASPCRRSRRSTTRSSRSRGTRRERFHADGIGDRSSSTLSHRCWRTRGIGDFWQHLLVAEGAFDIAIDPIVSLWDIAALVPIIEEAGGRWSTVDGRADVDGGSFVCTNGLLHDAVHRVARASVARRVRSVTVGIDIGTSSVKAVAADADGNVVARSRIPHEFLVPIAAALRARRRAARGTTVRSARSRRSATSTRARCRSRRWCRR